MKRGDDNDAINAALHRLTMKRKARRTKNKRLLEAICGYFQSGELLEKEWYMTQYPISKIQMSEYGLFIKIHSDFDSSDMTCDFICLTFDVLSYCFSHYQEALSDNHPFMPVLEAIDAASKPITEEVVCMLNDNDAEWFSFICQTLYILFILFRRCISSNVKKKRLLLYRCEKVTLLILWRCGDVEQNPGPALSDVTRDFCKKMISLLVVLFQNKKLGRNSGQADYKKTPDGWPDGIQYKDPSKCTNDIRDTMLITIQQLCIRKGLQIPTRWTLLIEKYKALQRLQCNKPKKDEFASDLHSWLCQLRSIETTDQTFDRLAEIGEQERNEVLDHMIERMREYLPDLTSQRLQSQVTRSKSREMESCSQSTMPSSIETNCATRRDCATGEVSVDEGKATNVTDFDQTVGDMDSGRTPGVSSHDSRSEFDRQMIINGGVATDNSTLDTVEAEKFTGFRDLLGGDAHSLEASDTGLMPLPQTHCSSLESVTNDNDMCMKRKFDTGAVVGDTETELKRRKMSDIHDETPYSTESGNSDLDKIFQSTDQTYNTGYSTDATLKDLMEMIEPGTEMPGHSTGDECNDLAQGDYAIHDMLDEVAKYLPDDFTMEKLLATCE